MLKALLLTLLTLLPLRAETDSWTKTEVALEVSFQMALFTDWKQTSTYHTTQARELNPLLGSHPSQRTINQWCFISSAGHLLVSDLLPHKQRIYWQAASMTVEWAVIARNYKLGVRIKW